MSNASFDDIDRLELLLEQIKAVEIERDAPPVVLRRPSRRNGYWCCRFAQRPDVSLIWRGNDQVVQSGSDLGY